VPFRIRRFIVDQADDLETALGEKGLDDNLGVTVRSRSEYNYAHKSSLSSPHPVGASRLKEL
jgi:hypothetical protein